MHTGGDVYVVEVVRGDDGVSLGYLGTCSSGVQADDWRIKHTLSTS